MHKLRFVFFFYKSGAFGICKLTKLTLRNRLTSLGHTWFHQFLNTRQRIVLKIGLCFAPVCLVKLFWPFLSKEKYEPFKVTFPVFFFRSVRQAVNRYSNKYCSNNYHLASSVVNAKSCSLPPSRGAEGLQLFVVHFRAVSKKRQFDQQFIGFRREQSWASSTDMNFLSFIVPWWNSKRCLQFRRASNLQLSSMFSFTFRSWYTLAKILASVWQEEGNFEVLKRCCIQIYPTIVFLLC